MLQLFMLLIINATAGNITSFIIVTVSVSGCNSQLFIVRAHGNSDNFHNWPSGTKSSVTVADFQNPSAENN